VGGDGQHARVLVEGELHAVAVMGVDVHVGHPHAVRPQAQDGQHGVVDVAEARGPGGHGVVEPAGEVKGP
jgi:hypothetical protein